MWSCRHLAVLLASGLLITITGPGHSTGINTYVPYFEKDLDISLTTISFLWMAALTASSVLTPIAGFLLDCFGARAASLLSSVLYAMALLGLSFANSVEVFTVALSLLRFSGPECMVLANTTVNRWFVSSRGKANAILRLFDNLMIMFPMLSTFLIDTFDWRISLAIMSVSLGSVGLCCASIIGTSPASEGLLPDKGRRDEKSDVNTSSAASTPEWTLMEVLHSPLFWAVTLSQSMFCVWWSGLNFHAIDFWATKGFTASQVAELSIPFSTGLIVSSMLAGVVVDTVDNKSRLLAYLFVALALNVILCHLTTTLVFARIFFLTYGSTNGAMQTVFGVIMADLFGSKNLGKINGITTAFWTLMSGAGPWFWSLCYQQTGDYELIVWLTVAGNCMGASFIYAYGRLRK
eukprot:m.108761 g.108761  ORF g.108761 m.108761 type:complete len:406 (-) comp13977_c0_seq2:138-1355(-)